MADELKRVDVFMGPYRGHLLDMPTAEADAAINAHWARDPYSTEPYGTGHDALSDEERTAAMTAATDWAQAQWAPFVNRRRLRERLPAVANRSGERCNQSGRLAM